jgi:hypothetical protein
MSIYSLVSSWSIASASLPVLPPPIPPDIRLTIDVKAAGLLDVYRALERATTRAKFTCHPTMKDYELWRKKGFDPPRRDMVCDDGRHDLIAPSWVSLAPESITIDVRIASTDGASESRIKQVVAELKKLLGADRSVMSVMETWSPNHALTTISPENSLSVIKPATIK